MEMSKKVEELLPSLFDENKLKRRNALKELKEIYSIVLHSEEPELNVIYIKVETAIFSALSDSSEVNRTEAILILIMFLQKISISEKGICNLISIIHHRIGKIPFAEDSEDVKIELLKVLNLSIKADINIMNHFSDIIDILVLCLPERCADIMLITCECIESLAISTKNKFKLQSASLVKPLIKCLSHRQFKIRCKALYIIGEVLIKGDPAQFEELSEPLGLCVKDIGQVRQQLVKLGYRLGTEFSDRYSYWPKILPLILFGLRDVDKFVKTYAISCWTEIGEQYARENEDLDSDIKSYIPKKYFVDEESEYGIGCQILARKSLSYLLRCIELSVDDWQEDTRLRATELLTTLIINGQESIVQYSNAIIPILCIAANDRESRISNEALLACKYFSFFVSPNVYLKILEQHLDSKMSHDILFSLLSGTPIDVLRGHIVEVLELLRLRDLSFSKNSYYAIVSIITLFASTSDVKSVCEDMLLPLLYFSRCADLDTKLCWEALQRLANKYGFVDVPEMVIVHSENIMMHIESSSLLWDEESSQLLIFEALSQFGAIEGNVQTAGKICSCVMNRKDCPIVQYKLIEIMQSVIVKRETSISSELENWTATFISEYINPLLIWAPGKTAGALRTVAVGFLLSMTPLSEYCSILCKALRPSVTCIPQLITDECEETRILTCKFIQNICKNSNIELDNKILLSFVEILIKRLDDKKKNVRYIASETLPVAMTLDTSSPEDVTDLVTTHMDSILIYLDEDNDVVRRNVFDTLRKAGEICPQYLKKVLQETGHKYRNEDLCNELASQLSLLNIK